MNISTSLLSVMLLMASLPAWADADRSADLRYCLDMKSNEEIAKCAGEISSGNKGNPLSKQEAERILSKEIAITPAATSEKPGKGLLPGKTEGSSN